MEYSLRNKSISPQSLRQRKPLNRCIKPSKSSPVNSPPECKVNQSFKTVAESICSASPASDADGDTIGSRLSRRRSTAANAGSDSLSNVKGRAARKSCIPKIVLNDDTAREESPAKDLSVEASIQANEDESTCDSIKVLGKVNKRRSVTGDIATSDEKMTRLRGKIKECENVEISPAKVTRIRKRKLSEDCEVAELHTSPKGVQSNAANQYSNESNSCQKTFSVAALKTCESKLYRNTLQVTLHDVCLQTPIVSIKTEMNKTIAKKKENALISPAEKDLKSSKATQTEKKLSFAELRSWKIEDHKSVAVQSSQTCYSTFCKSKGVQFHAALKNKSIQTSYEVAHKETSTIDINSSGENDLMSIMLEELKKLRDLRCELLVPKIIANPPSLNSVNQGQTIASKSCNENIKTAVPADERKRHSKGHMHKEKLEEKTGVLDPLSSNKKVTVSSLQMSKITSKSTLLDPLVDTNQLKKRVQASVLSVTNKKKVERPKSSCEQVAGKLEDSCGSWERDVTNRMKGHGCRKIDEKEGSKERADQTSNKKNDHLKGLPEKTELLKKRNATGEKSLADHVLVDLTSSPSVQRSKVPTERRLSVGANSFASDLNVNDSIVHASVSKKLSLNEKGEKSLSKNPKRLEVKTSSSTSNAVQKIKKVHVSSKVEDNLKRHSASDINLEISSSTPKNEKRGSVKGLNELSEVSQRSGNTRKSSPCSSSSNMNDRRNISPSHHGSVKDSKMKTISKEKGKDFQDVESNVSELKGNEKEPINRETTDTPPSIIIDDKISEVKQETYDFSYNKDDDDDVISLYPESEYAEMFSCLDNHPINVSESCIADKYPSSSFNAEVNDNSKCFPLDKSMGEGDMVQTTSVKGVENIVEGVLKENELQKECHFHSENVRLKEVVVAEADASIGNSCTAKPENVDVNNTPLLEDNVEMEIVHGNDNEILPVTRSIPSGQNLDLNNEIEIVHHSETFEESKPSVTEQEPICAESSQNTVESESLTKEAAEENTESDELHKQNCDTVTTSVEAVVESFPVSGVGQQKWENSTSSSHSETSPENGRDNKTKGKMRNLPPPSIFKGLCYNFLRGFCMCTRFIHRYPPNFLQTMEVSNSWEIYRILIYAVEKNFSKFLKEFAVQLATILAYRKEGNLLVDFLLEFRFKWEMGRNGFWYSALKLMLDCGNCPEKNSFSVLQFIINKYLLKIDLSKKVNSTIVDKIVIISSTFTDLNNICGILNSITSKDVFLEDSTIETLLQLSLSATSRSDRNKLCQCVGSILSITNFCVPLQQNIVKLFFELIDILKRNGQEELVRQLKNKGIVSINPEEYSNCVLDPVFEVNEKLTELPQSQQNFRKSTGGELQGKNLKRISESEVGDCSPYKKLRISFDQSEIHDSDRRKNLGNVPGMGYVNMKRQSIQGVDSHIPIHRNQGRNYVTFEESASNLASSSSSTNVPSFPYTLSPLNRYGPSTPTLGNVSTIGPKSNYCVSRQFMPQNTSCDNSGLSSDGINCSGRNASMSNFSEPHVQTQQLMNYNSPDVKGCPSNCSSEDISESQTDQNPPELSLNTSSTAISLSHLSKKPDLTSENQLVKAYKKAVWSPALIISTFNPWLVSPKLQVQLSKLSCKILEEDFTVAALSLRSLLHCLDSKELRRNKKTDDIKKMISTTIFNMILKMVISDAWNEAYKFLKMSDSANLPLFFSEAFIEEEMSVSRKILVLSEICFRVNEMNEAIGYIKQGKLFGPVSTWKYNNFEGDVEIQVTLLTSLISKLTSGGFSDTAPALFLAVNKAQKSLYQPIDLTVHADKVILCALNATNIKKAHEVYMTLLPCGVFLQKTTYRALLIGLVFTKQFSLARDIFLQVRHYKIYPSFRERQIDHEIFLCSYWTKEEIFIMLDNYMRLIFYNGVRNKDTSKIDAQDFEMNIHIKVMDAPESLSVTLNRLKEGGDERSQEPVPNCLALMCNTLEEIHDRVSFVLENMFFPTILYDCIIIKEELEELMTLHPNSVQEYIYARFVRNSE